MSDFLTGGAPVVIILWLIAIHLGVLPFAHAADRNEAGESRG